ncbi:hypothetical protein ACNKXS_13725 [Christiangramia marina]|uniref:hypothetical protein n=1 Tax=Christiangramia marina TaxID=409436 RepID=UPI003AA91AEE
MYLQNHLKFGKQIYSLEYNGTLDEYRINMVSATFSGNKVKKNNEESFVSVNNLKDKIQNKHCFLTISGPQVLVKEASKKSSHMDALKETFPNLDLESIYYQIWEVENAFLIAIARKDFVNSIVELLNNNSILVVGFSLSFLSLQNIFKWVEPKIVHIENFNVKQDFGKIRVYQSVKTRNFIENYIIQDETINFKYLVSYSAIFNYFTAQTFSLSNLHERNEYLSKYYIQKRFFWKFLKISLSSLIVILLINYIFFSSFHNQYRELIDKEIASQENHLSYQSLKNDRENKLKLIENIKSNGNSNVIYRLNQLVVEKPKDISFLEMVFQPLQSNIVPNEPIILNENYILLKGITRNDTAFSKWMINLEKYYWIDNVKVIDFVNEDRKESKFSILINTTDDPKK